MPARYLLLAAVCAMCAVVPLRAHHSHGNYDLTTWTTMNGEVKELSPARPAFLDLSGRQGRQRRATDNVGARSHGPRRSHEGGRQARRREAGRHDSGPVPSSQRRLERVSPRIRDADARRHRARARCRKGLGRRRWRRVQHRRTRRDAALTAGALYGASLSRYCDFGSAKLRIEIAATPAALAPARRHGHELLAVHHVDRRRGEHAGAGVELPQRLAGLARRRRRNSPAMLLPRADEHDAARRHHRAGLSVAFERLLPLELAGRRIERGEVALAPRPGRR